MRMRKFLCLAVIVAVVMSAVSASALSLGDLIPMKKVIPMNKVAPAAEALPENALISRPEDSVYGLLRLDDTGAFLRWLASEENINLLMPLILKSEDSSDIMAGIEFFRAFATKTPIKSAAIIIGGYDPDTKKPPFFQMAFTVDSSMAGTVKKIADGTAEDTDFAKIILGNDNPITAIAQTMIKADKLNDGSYRVDNEIFLKAEGDMLVLAMNADELNASLGALKFAENRLFNTLTRKFTDKDFALIHVDYKTLDKMDTDKNFDDADELVTELFDKPINFEFAFDSKPDKFVLSFGMNFIEAVKKEYADKMTEPVKPVKGSYLTLGGKNSPLFALGAVLNLSSLKDNKETKDAWKEIVRQARVRFSISEDEIASFFNGPFSFTVNDSVTYEGVKIPALYISQTGMKDSARKIFARLTKSPHFQKVQDGVLQLDTSISPVSCLVQDKGSALGINFAELANLNTKPAAKPALQSLVDAEGIVALWLDFDEIRSWIMDDENGVMAMAIPMAKVFGYGEIAEAVNDILTAEFSVPSFSFRAENVETFRFEFANVKINPENGIIAKAIKIYQKFSK